MADKAAAPSDNKAETVPENAQDLTAFVQNMLEQMVNNREKYNIY